MLADYGYPPLPVPTVVGHIGKGAQNLVARCLEEYGYRLDGDPGWTGESGAPPGDTVAAALHVFEGHYAAHLLDETEVYGGVEELLRDLAHAGRGMAIVSNKPEGFCRDILDQLGLAGYFRIVVGGEALPKRKPAPDPIWHAIQACTGRSAEDALAVMIGDTWIDTEAARAAGIPAVLVGWGLGDRELARSSGPDAWAEDAPTLRQLLAGDA